VLITVVYLRQICSQKVLSDTLEVSDFTIGYWIAETRKLFTEHHVTIPATTMRFTTAAQLRGYLNNDDIPAQHPRISETLSHPALTGMSREELRQMIERLTPLQAARLERLRYQRVAFSYTTRLEAARAYEHRLSYPHSFTSCSAGCTTSRSDTRQCGFGPKNPAPLQEAKSCDISHIIGCFMPACTES
jgi:hypothetical protein